LKGLHILQNLDLTIGQCSITDIGIDVFSKNLKGLDSLESLSLNLSGNSQITDQGLENLARNLKKVVHLKEVFFRIYYCPQASRVGRDKVLDLLTKHARVGFRGRTELHEKPQRKMKLLMMFLVVGVIGLFLSQVMRFVIEKLHEIYPENQ